MEVCLVVARRHLLTRLTGGSEERTDLHADGLERIPAALPVHPDHAVVRAVLRHLGRVSSAHVVAPVGVGGVAAVVPPAAAVLLGALLGRIAGRPGGRKRAPVMLLFQIVFIDFSIERKKHKAK